MNLKKIWPVLALLGVGVLVWLWQAHRLPFVPGNKIELGKSTQVAEQEVKPSSPVPAQEPPAGPAGSPPSPEAQPLQAPASVQENLPAAGPQAASPPEPTQNYSVEIKKFRTFQQAKKFLSQLQKKGQRGYITKHPKDKNPFMVWLGPFKTRQEAQAVARAIKKKCRVSPQVKAKAVLPPK